MHTLSSSLGETDSDDDQKNHRHTPREKAERPGARRDLHV